MTKKTTKLKPSSKFIIANNVYFKLIDTKTTRTYHRQGKIRGKKLCCVMPIRKEKYDKEHKRYINLNKK